MAQALIAIRRDDRFRDPSLADPDDSGGKEESETAFFTFGPARGIHYDFPDRVNYYSHVKNAWNGMVKYALHDNGSPGGAWSTGKQPSDGQPLSYSMVPNFEDYGPGALHPAGS